MELIVVTFELIDYVVFVDVVFVVLVHCVVFEGDVVVPGVVVLVNVVVPVLGMPDTSGQTKRFSKIVFVLLKAIVQIKKSLLSPVLIKIS